MLLLQRFSVQRKNILRGGDYKRVRNVLTARDLIIEQGGFSAFHNHNQVALYEAFDQPGFIGNSPTLMASTDLLGTLPREVRQCVYFYLLFIDEGREKHVGKKRNGETEYSFIDELHAMLALPGNPYYIASRRKITGKQGVVWSDAVEEAFFEGL